MDDLQRSPMFPKEPLSKWKIFFLRMRRGKDNKQTLEFIKRLNSHEQLKGKNLQRYADYETKRTQRKKQTAPEPKAEEI
jgi:hypothetical protein